MSSASLSAWFSRSVSVLVLAALAPAAFGHPGHGGGSAPAPANTASPQQDSQGTYDPSRVWAEDPYDRQKHCPVTGELLGTRGKAIAVNTGIGEKTPSRLGKLFGQQPVAGHVIYVCCPACVAKVKADPVEYYFRVIRDRAGQSMIETPTKGKSATVEPCACKQAAADGETSSAPGRGYGGQKTCPVTGQALGSMGPPVPVRIGGEIIYVCCQGCVAKFQGDPGAYLARARAEKTSP